MNNNMPHQFSTWTVAALFVAAATTALSASPTLFPDNGHYYDFINTSLDWDNANAAAQQQTFLGFSGHLATISSAQEQSFVYDQIYRPHLPALTIEYATWLGGYQIAGSPEPAGGWVWSTGETWNYSNWGAGEPNDFGGEYKLAMWGTGLWNDYVGDKFGAPNVGPIGYLVEFEVPEPSAFALLGLGGTTLLMFRRVACKKTGGGI
jgi:hypothetical protein